jgi:hypothetical protein
MTKKELKSIILIAIEKQKSRFSAYTNATNPQEIASANEYKGIINALESVRDAIDAPRPLSAFSLLLLTR